MYVTGAFSWSYESKMENRNYNCNEYLVEITIFWLQTLRRRTAGRPLRLASPAAAAALARASGTRDGITELKTCCNLRLPRVS